MQDSSIVTGDHSEPSHAEIYVNSIFEELEHVNFDVWPILRLYEFQLLTILQFQFRSMSRKLGEKSQQAPFEP